MVGLVDDDPHVFATTLVEKSKVYVDAARLIQRARYASLEGLECNARAPARWLDARGFIEGEYTFDEIAPAVIDALDKVAARHRSRFGRFVPDGPSPRRYP